MRLQCLLLAALLTAGSVKNSAAEYSAEYSAVSISTFARALRGEKDYHRAHIELLRLKAYYPEFISDQRTAVSSLYFNYKKEDYYSLKNMTAAGYSGDDPSVQDIYRIFAYDSFIKTENFHKAYTSLEPYRSSADADIEVLLNKRKYHGLLIRGEIESARNFIYQTGMNEDYLMTAAFAEKKISDKKSRALAAAAGIIPGMGFWYSGQGGTGILSIIVIAVTAGASYMAFSSGNDGIALFTASISGFFYLGSIAGGYTAAARYNSLIDGDIRDYAAEKLSFENDREYLMDKYGAWPHE